MKRFVNHVWLRGMNVIVYPYFDLLNKNWIFETLSHICMRASFIFPKMILLFWKLCEKFWGSLLTSKIKMKFPKPYYTSTGHLQSYSRIWFGYKYIKCYFTLLEPDFFFVFFTKTSFPRTLLTPGMKIKIPKSYCASKGHSPSMFQEMIMIRCIM